MEIKRILISQPEPTGASPYSDLVAKKGLTIDFRPFFRVQGVSVRDFVAQRVTILDYTAIVFTSRMAIDAFFHICEQTRVNVPETMKYFCQSEAIAVYLQKYIVYRKRKIFFGSGTVASMVQSIGAKHKGENFLIACTDQLKPDVHKLFTKEKLKHGSAVFVRTVSNDIRDIDLHNYQIVALPTLSRRRKPGRNSSRSRCCSPPMVPRPPVPLKRQVCKWPSRHRRPRLLPLPRRSAIIWIPTSRDE